MAIRAFAGAFAIMCASGQGGTDFGDCTHCPALIDEDSVLAIVSPSAMCFNSPYWGKAIRDSFVSQIFFVGMLKWQARTIASCLDGRLHHILLPFIIDSGGVTKIGIRATEKLVSAGASFDPDDRLKLCKIELALPRGARDCVYRWEDYSPGVRDLDDGHDLREWQ